MSELADWNLSNEDVADALAAAGINPECNGCPNLRRRLARVAMLRELAQRLHPSRDIGEVLAEPFDDAADEIEAGIAPWARNCRGTVALPDGAAVKARTVCGSPQVWTSWHEDNGKIPIVVDDTTLMRLLEATDGNTNE